MARARHKQGAMPQSFLTPGGVNKRYARPFERKIRSQEHRYKKVSKEEFLKSEEKKARLVWSTALSP